MGHNNGRTIRISENLHQELEKIKREGKYQSYNDVLRTMYWAYITSKPNMEGNNNVEK